MSPLIEDFAVLSDPQTAALVHGRGSLDWCCLPRFDSEACFARLLGRTEHGHWPIAAAAPARPARRYRAGDSCRPAHRTMNGQACAHTLDLYERGRGVRLAAVASGGWRCEVCGPSLSRRSRGGAGGL